MAELSIDLGNYNTIVTFRKGTHPAPKVLGGVAREIRELPSALIIPSLVHLGDRIRIGEEVLREGLYEAEACFRDLKDHVLHPSPVARNVRGRRYTHKKAAASFLSELARRLWQDLAEPLTVVFLFPSVGGPRHMV